MSDPPEDTSDGHPSQASDGSDGCPSHGDADAASARPIVFLDIDGVLNTTKHNTQIHLEAPYLKRLKTIVEATDALIVLTTFWRHFHEYISYVLHRHGIDVARHTLPLPMGATAGKQCTKKFLHFHQIRQRENGYHGVGEESNAMIGRSAEDEGEYASRAEEIEAWLQMYGERYMGNKESNAGESANGEAINGSAKGEYDFHRERWRYCILDDRPTAAKPGTPLFERFVLTETKLGLTEEDAERAIKLLRLGP